MTISHSGLLFGPPCRCTPNKRSQKCNRLFFVGGGAQLHRRTQDFTMEGVHVVGPGQEVWGRVPLGPCGVHGQSLGRESGVRSPPEAEGKCEISIQFLTFSCTTFRI